MNSGSCSQKLSYCNWIWYMGVVRDNIRCLHKVHTLFQAGLAAGQSFVTSWASLVGELNFSYLHSQY